MFRAQFDSTSEELALLDLLKNVSFKRSSLKFRKKLIWLLFVRFGYLKLLSSALVISFLRILFIFLTEFFVVLKVI